jgi:hypothetical protein
MFGNGVIWTFANNTSKMKRLAAHNFEDILQVCWCSSFVCIGSLLCSQLRVRYSDFRRVIPTWAWSSPAIPSILICTVACACEALHALRVYHDFLEETFKKLAQKLCKFQCNTCSAFKTTELPKEKAAHHQRLAQWSETNTTPSESSSARLKSFNLSTYKFHAMGDYVRTIRLFGSTDSFTTQMVRICCLSTIYLKLNCLWRAGSQGLKGILSFNQQTRHPGAVSQARAQAPRTSTGGRSRSYILLWQ